MMGGVGVVGPLALFIVLMLASWPYRMNFFFLTLAQLVLWLIGLWALVPTGEATEATVAYALLGVCAFVFGHLVIAHLVPLRSNAPVSGRRTISPAFVWSVIIVSSVFTVYHFLVTGLPVLSDSIETERFDVTGSGFFGIPGRMYLYGTQMAWIVASADASMRGVLWVKSRPWLVASATIVASSAVSGFKGQFLALAVFVFGTHAVVYNGGLRIGNFLRRFWWIPTGGVAYLFGVATLYPSYTQSSGSLTDKLIERATSVGAEPAALVLTRQLRYQMQNVQANDFSFFLHKYSGQDVTDLYSFERLVSTSILGFSPVNPGYAPPVTIGGLAELTYSFNGPVAMTVLLVAGVSLAIVDRIPFRTAFGSAGAAVFALVLTTWMLKGDLAYQSLNNLAVVLMLAITGVVGWLVAGRGPLLEAVGDEVLEPLSRRRLSTRRPTRASANASSSEVVPNG